MNAWDKLSMSEKADVMKLALEGGVYDLDSIREGYNKFAEGGDINRFFNLPLLFDTFPPPIIFMLIIEETLRGGSSEVVFLCFPVSI